MGKERGKSGREIGIKREAASSKNVSDPRGTPHGLCLYWNNAERTPLSPFWTLTPGVRGLIFLTCPVCRQSAGLTPSAPSPVPVHPRGCPREQGPFACRPREPPPAGAFSLSFLEAFTGNQGEARRGQERFKRDRPARSRSSPPCPALSPHSLRAHGSSLALPPEPSAPAGTLGVPPPAVPPLSVPCGHLQLSSHLALPLPPATCTRMNIEENTQKTRKSDMALNIVNAVTAVAACTTEILRAIDKIQSECKRKEREKTRNNQESTTKKDLESKISREFQDLENKMEALSKDFQKWEGSTLYDVELLTKEVEKNQGEQGPWHAEFPPGKREKEKARALESKLRKNIRQLSRRVGTLEEDVWDWPITMKFELQVRRAELEKIEGMDVDDIALALGNMLRKNKRQLSQKIWTLEDDIKECMDTTKYEIQVFREELEERNRGTNEE
ncbi:PREDICTED: protein IQ-DOMAIN 14-like isoform X2 [Ficedula albicollis]|uniref:protein IQ-DOMAIN 14-like isoform X2 n=1 Tax=Ficedula albicollis TaxID=59894 RepID=UPI0007AD9419|nr:PREDICTED: protein IQ-DOMAIN 14-like isoform X2 [Ficedula albicollis]